MHYCKNCDQNVTGKKEFSFFWFLVLCLTGIGGIFYLIYYPFKKRTCPICRSSIFKALKNK